MLAEGGLDADQASVLNELVISSCWPSELRDLLLEKIAAATNMLPVSITVSGAGRAKLQDFEYIFEYFTMEHWHAFATQGVPEEAKRDVVLDIAVQLGLRNPKESTVQMLSTLYKVIVDGPEKIRLLPWGTKLEVGRHVKRVWKRKVSSVGPAMVQIETLWTSPGGYNAAYPEQFKVVYGPGNSPTRCPYPELVLRELQSGFPMRCTKKATPMVMQPMDMASMMQHVMRQIMGGQMQHLSDLGPSKQSSGINLQMTGPFAKSGSASGNLLALPMFSSAAKPPASDVAGVSVAAKPPASDVASGLATADVAGSSVATDSAASLVVAPARRVMKASVESCTADILMAMGERDKAKALNKKATQEGKPKVVASPTRQGKGKAKVVETRPGKGQGKPKVEKPKVKERNMKKKGLAGRPGKVPSLGCSKCRFAKAGCSQCRARRERNLA